MKSFLLSELEKKSNDQVKFVANNIKQILLNLKSSYRGLLCLMRYCIIMNDPHLLNCRVVVRSTSNKTLFEKYVRMPNLIKSKEF